MDMYVANWREGMEVSSSLSLFRNLKYSYQPAPYLYKVLNKKMQERFFKTKIITTSIVSRDWTLYRGHREQRKCTLCELNDIEDEYHFVLRCSKYQTLRDVYIKRYYSRNPSMFKLIKLLNCDKIKSLNNLTVYIIKAFKLMLQVHNNVD